MGTWRSVAKLSEVKPDRPHAVSVDGRRIAIFNANGQFYAIDSACPHKGGPLELGVVEGETVYCPLHGWAFDVTNGICKDHPEKFVERYPVRTLGDAIQIEID